MRARLLLCALLGASCFGASQAGNVCCGCGNKRQTSDIGPKLRNVSTVRVGSHLAPNAPFVTVHVCEPRTPTRCVTLRHVTIDTGSVGLRVLEGALGALRLPPVGVPGPAPPGSRLTACYPFAPGFVWGRMRQALVWIGDAAPEEAVPIQVVADGSGPMDPMPPVLCTAQGPDFGATLRGRVDGVLGIGPGETDCGEACADTGEMPLLPMYFNCTASGECRATAVEDQHQARNPVLGLSIDLRGGYRLTLPAIPPGGSEQRVNGKLILGLDSLPNNAIPNGDEVLEYAPLQAFPGEAPSTGRRLFSHPSSVQFALSWRGGHGFNHMPPGTSVDTGALHATADLELPRCNQRDLRDLYCPGKGEFGRVGFPGVDELGLVQAADPTLPILGGHVALQGLVGPPALYGRRQLGMPNLYGTEFVVHLEPILGSPRTPISELLQRMR